MKHGIARKTLLSLFLGLIFFLPDVLYAFVDPRFPLCVNPEKFLLVFLLGVLISLSESKKTVYAALFVFGFMNLVQFCCMAYFGTYLSPFALAAAFKDSGDVALEVGHMFSRLWYLTLIVGVPYGVYAYVVHKSANRFCFKFGGALTVLFFAAFVVRANTPSGAHQMLFKRTCYVSFNTMNAFTGYFGNILPRALIKRGTGGGMYEPYKVTKTQTFDKPFTVFVVYGESVNRHHMSLFGYERDTTPLLKKRLKTDKNFAAHEAYSAAVNTLISIPTFLHLQREPDNYKKQVEADSYLPRLAQENGFHTVYIGFQGESVRQKSALSHIDDYYVYEAGVKPDEEAYFKDAVSQIDFTKPTFVFLNKRNLHTPFIDNYRNAHGDFAKWRTENVDDDAYRVNSYDNAMLYEDYLLTMMIDWLRDNVKTPVYFYFIGDHGEAFGETSAEYKTGLHGHGALLWSIYHVPFLFDGINAPQNDPHVADVKAAFKPTAYEVGLLIAKRLGYAVENPNLTGDVYYVNGMDLMGRAGYVELKKDRAAGTVSESVILKTP